MEGDNFHFLGLGIGHVGSRNVHYGMRRVMHETYKDWTQGRLKFVGADGKELASQVQVPEPTKEQLNAVPGAALAYEGLGKMTFKAVIRSGRYLDIDSKWTEEFTKAPSVVAEAFMNLQKHHSEGRMGNQHHQTSVLNTGLQT
jgi:hypothetical protein